MMDDPNMHAYDQMYADMPEGFAAIPVMHWLEDRLDNSLRLAALKTGADRDGWLEDAYYYGLVINHLNGCHVLSQENLTPEGAMTNAGEKLRVVSKSVRCRAVFLKVWRYRSYSAGKFVGWSQLKDIWKCPDCGLWTAYKSTFRDYVCEYFARNAGRRCPQPRRRQNEQSNDS